MKKTAIAFLVIIMIFQILIINTVAGEVYDLYCEGTRIELDIPPQQVNGQLLAPLRAFSEGLGCYVEWEGQTQQATLIKNDTILIMAMDSKKYTLNSVTKETDIAMQLVDGRTLIPIKLIAESFRYNYFVDDTNFNIHVYSGSEINPIQPLFTLFNNKYTKEPDSNTDILGLLKYNGNSLMSVKCSENTLQSPTDYAVNGTSFILKKEFIRTLPSGKNTLSLVFSNGFELETIIYVIDKKYTSQDSQYDLFVDGQKITFDSSLFVIDGDFFAPLRAFSESIGLSVSWYEDLRQIVLENNADILIMTIDMKTYLFNDQTFLFNVPPQIINDRTSIPVRPIAEKFGYNYFFDEENGNIQVYTGTQIPPLLPMVSITDNEYVKDPDSNKDIMASIKYNGKTLQSIANDGITLQMPRDYIMSGNTLTIKREYIRTLPGGINTLTFFFSDGASVDVTLKIIDGIKLPQYTSFELYVDSVKIPTDIPLCILDGQYLAPLRAFAEGLGCSVEWNGDLEQATFKDLYKTVTMQVESLTYTTNSIKKLLSIPMFIYNGRTIVPIKTIAEEFGATYEEDIVNNKILIETPKISVLNVTIQSGQPLTMSRIKGLTSIELAVSCKNNNFPTTFILACYDDNGRLLYFQSINAILNKSTANPVVFYLNNFPDGIKSIKILSWESLQGMIPIRDIILID